MATSIDPTFRSLMRRLTPWWLHGRIVWAVLQAIADQMDLLTDMIYSAVALRFPRLGQPDALPLIGIERKIPRGRAEPDVTYISRLLRWFDDHATRGGPYAMLKQLHAFWAATPFPITLVYRSGLQFAMDLSGNVTRGPSGMSEPGPWPHWRLFFNWPFTVHGDGSWSDPGTWADGGVWDSDLSPEDVAEIRLVPTAWNAAHCDGTIFVVPPGTEIWDLPAGTWDEPGGTWGSGGEVVAIAVNN